MKRAAVFVCAALFAPVLFAGQGIYKWTDAQGQVHYGEAPPEGTASTEVTVKESPAPAAVPQQDREESTQRLLRAFEEERTQKQEQEAKSARENERRKRNCTIARDRLRSYQEAGALYNLDKQGERRILNDSEHSAAMREAEADVKTYCK